MVSCSSRLGDWRRFVGESVVLYWPMVAAFVASIALLGAMFLRVSVSELPRVGVPLSWSDAVRSGALRPAGAGCSARPW